jgi:branched-chain amino acid transport system substrate-binding protein
MTKSLSALAVAGLLAAPALAADKIKVGFLSTLSGPNSALGIDIRDAFNLAVKQNGGKLGGLPAEVIVADDQLNPDAGRQAAEKLLKKDNVDLMTGIVFSNVMLAVGPLAFDNKTYFISANAGPSQYAGEQCNKYFFNVAWQNDNYHESAGKYAADKGFKNAVLVAPNYPAGKDALTGFKRYYKGQIADEIYTKLGQLDYAVEIAQIRSAKPESVYVFLPGGMGVNFVKQFVGAGLNKQTNLILSGFGADEDTIKAVGEPMVGLVNAAHWAPDFTNAESKKFVAAFEKEYGRVPSIYAAQGYDAAQLIDAAVRDVKGKIEDKEALGKAIQAANFKSVRGPFKFGPNHYPVQNFYARTIVKDAQGRITNKTLGPVFTNHSDAYAAQCKM